MESLWGQEGDSQTFSPVQNSVQNTQSNYSSVSSSEVSACCLEEVHSAAALHVLFMSQNILRSFYVNILLDEIMVICWIQCSVTQFSQFQNFDQIFKGCVFVASLKYT